MTDLHAMYIFIYKTNIKKPQFLCVCFFLTALTFVSSYVLLLSELGAHVEVNLGKKRYGFI